MKGHFTEEDIQMAKEHTKRSSISLSIREMQIQTIMWHYSVPNRVAITDNEKWWRGYRTTGPFITEGRSVADELPRPWSSSSTEMLEIFHYLIVMVVVFGCNVFVITHEGIHLGCMFSSGCVLYFNSNVYFKHTNKNSSDTIVQQK